MKQLPRKPAHPALGYIGAGLLCAICALICLPLLGRLDQANIVMLFLLAVAAASACWGKGPGVLAAFTSVLLFDVLFVEPRFSLVVHDGQYLITFTVMLVVALLVSHFATRLQQQLDTANAREQQITTLYQCAHELAGAMTLAQVQQALDKLNETLAASRLILYIPDHNEQLVCTSDQDKPAKALPDYTAILSAYHSSEPLFTHAFNPSDSITAYLPLHGATRPRGVLVMNIDERAWPVASSRNEFFRMLSSLAATALERLHFVEVAQCSELAMKAETLRSTILSSISHDIRTPLTVLVGTADTLLMTHTALPEESLALLGSLRNQAFALHGMVENLLEMARLQSGKVTLKREWLPLEEIIGSSIHLSGDALASHTIRVDIPEQMPLVHVDPLLMERVLCNLLDNARQHAPLSSIIRISASQQEGCISINIFNDGAPFPDNAASLLDIFARGDYESTSQGFGIGLAICRSIVEAHGGTIMLQNPAQGGACVVIRLPQGCPPVIDTDDAEGAIQ